MTKVVRWIEPLGSGAAGHIRCEADWKDVADYMLFEYEPRFKDHPRYPMFKTAEDAVEDFCITHWATIIDVD